MHDAYAFNSPATVRAKTALAMETGLGGVTMSDIEIVRAESGAPLVLLHDTAATKAAELGITEWKITITHTESLAQAIAVAL